MNINKSVVHSPVPCCVIDGRFSYTFRSEKRDQEVRLHCAKDGFEPTLFIFPDGNQGVVSITLEGTSTFGPITVHEWASRLKYADSFSTVHGRQVGLLGALYEFCRLS